MNKKFLSAILFAAFLKKPLFLRWKEKESWSVEER